MNIALNKKIGSVLIIACLFLFTACGVHAAADNGELTQMEFAKLLIGAMGLEVPACPEGTSYSEYYNSLTNTLETNGVKSLIGYNPNNHVSYGDMAIALYEAIGVERGVRGSVMTADSKLDHLANHGFIPRAVTGAIVTESAARGILANPALLKAISERFGY